MKITYIHPKWQSSLLSNVTQLQTNVYRNIDMTKPLKRVILFWICYIIRGAFDIYQLHIWEEL